MLIILPVAISITLLLFTNSLHAQTKAFPSAEGYGQFATGGRGGEIYEVTNLNDNGPGSLREAIEASGKRIVVFRVSGTIELESDLKIRNDNITIAGQTAPGDGICISKVPIEITELTETEYDCPSFTIDADNVIIRFIRFRLGDTIDNSLGVDREAIEFEADAIFGRRHKNIIIDHCSMSWSIDETASFYDNEDFTLQWCIISESLWNSFHPKGEHGYGGIWGGMGATFHHNLLAHHTSRNPRFNGSRYNSTPETEIVDFVNNVIYNWGFNSAYGGENGNQNIRANYYKYGPATDESKRNRIVEPSDANGKWYVADNYVYGYPDITANNWAGGVQGSHWVDAYSHNITEPFPISPVKTQTAEEAYELVLDTAGVSFPVRDEIDARVVEETRTGTASFGATYGGGGLGIIDSQTDVGGWPLLESTTPPTDSDHDGMPDDWEVDNGLNPQDNEDRNLIDSESGYTMVELYINGLVDDMTTDVGEESEIAYNFTLHQNYPNPFNPQTKISYEIDKRSYVTLEVYDILGQVVTKLVEEVKAPGKYHVSWRPNSSTSSGFYLARLKVGNNIQTIKMIYMK